MIDLSNENIIHKKEGNIEYIQFRKLLEYEKYVTHCFTIKPLDFGTNDNFYNNKEKIENDYKIISEIIGFDEKNIVRPRQTHTNNVAKIIDESGIFIDKLNDIDGLITDKSNKVLSLTFADCTPIFLFDFNKKVIGNIHSGWKGTLNKIGKIAVEKMIKEYNCEAQNIICCIGPTIRKCHFEVDEDVKNMFYEQYNYTNKIDEIIYKGEVKENKQKYYIDTVDINKLLMKEAGLVDENIIDSGICTVCNSDKIHSYRIDKEKSGRNTSIMFLK